MRDNNLIGAPDATRARTDFCYLTRSLNNMSVRIVRFSEISNLAGAPGRIRTADPQIRSLVLYPAELRAPAAHRTGNVPGPAEAGGSGLSL